MRDRIARLDLADSNARAFLRERPETENDQAIGTTDALTVRKQIGEKKLEFCAFAQRARRCGAVRRVL